MLAVVDAWSPLSRIGVAAASAGLLTLALTPLVERMAGAGGWWDDPSSTRWHEAPTPHLGGIALFASVAAALGISGSGAAFWMPVWTGAMLLFVMGLADDLWGLAPVVKVVGQLGSAGLVLWSGLLFWPSAPPEVAWPLTVLWVLGVTNALNLLDAMDGVAAGVSAVAAAAVATIAVLQGRVSLAAVAAALAAAEGAFVVFNAPPARIFMGDCGSLPLGYLLAVLGLAIQSQGGPGAVPLTPILVLAVPLFDTLFVSVTRLGRGQSVAEGGIDHTMHRLVRLGGSERQVAAAFWGAGLLCGGAAVAAEVAAPHIGYGLTAGIVTTAVAAGVLVARWTEPEPPAASTP